MAAALRARLELLGGKEIIATFDKIKQGAKEGFGTIEKEAKKATKDVKELERELAKLEAEAKAIRANIRVTKGQSLTGEQQQALAFAKQLEQQAAGVRQQIETANDSLRMGGGDALRTLAGSADKDLLKVASATDQIDASLADIRSSGGFGGLITDEQIARLENVSQSLRLKNTDYFDGLGRRVETADSIDVVKKQESDAKEEARQARLAKAADRRRRSEKVASEKAAADAAAEDKAREEALQKQNETIRRSMETYRRRQERDSRYLQQLSEQSSQAELKRMKAVASYREHQVLKTADDERRAGERIAAQWRVDLARRAAMEREAVRLSARSRLADLTGSAVRPRHELMFGDGALGDLKNSKAFNVVLGGLGVGLADLQKGFQNAFGEGRIFSGVIGQIGHTLSSTLRDVGAFGKALEGLAGALGTVALRSTVATAVVGLVGAIGVALAALGGAAVVAGIGAISALAALNVQGLKNAADEIGTSVESLTRLSYVGNIAGIAQDDMTKGLKALQELSVGVVTGAKSAADATRLLNGAGVEVWKRGTNDLKDQVDVVKELARAYQNLANPTLKKAWIEQLGGDSFGDIAKLVPLLETPLDKIEERLRKADRSGFTVVEGQLKALTHLAELFREIWANVIGTANKLTGQIMPSLEPMLQAFNTWLLDHQQQIVDYLIWLFQSVVTISADFFNLYKSGGAARVVNAWTKTLYDDTMKVVDVFKQLWSAFKVGWDFAAPYLDQLGEKLGTGGAISTALVLLSAWVLGFFGLFKAGAKTAVAALGIVSGFITSTIIPVIRGALVWIAGIVGWPLLLAGSIGLVSAFWDEIGSLIEGAWKKFKETFPETAKALEDAFGPAVQAVKEFAADFAGTMERNLPQTTALIRELGETLKGFSWSNLYKGLDEGGNAVLFVLAQALESISFSLRYALEAMKEFGKVFAGSRANPANKANTPAREIGKGLVESVLGPTFGPLTDLFYGKAVNDLSDAVSGTAPPPPVDPASIPAGSIDDVSTRSPEFSIPPPVSVPSPDAADERSRRVVPPPSVPSAGTARVPSAVPAAAPAAPEGVMANADRLMAGLAALLSGQAAPVPAPAAPSYAVPNPGSSQIAGASSPAFAGGSAPYSEDMLKSLFAGATPFVINVDTGDTVYAVAPQGSDLQGVAAALGANSRAQIAPRRF